MSLLPVSRFNDYWQAITHIEAEQFLVQSKIAMLPSMKKQHVDEWFKYLKGQQFSGGVSRREMTLRDLAAKLSEGVGNG